MPNSVSKTIFAVQFYVWNLGFRSLFPKFQDNGIRYPVSQSIQIELGLLGAVALMGAAVQLRILSVLQHKLKEISLEQQKQKHRRRAECRRTVQCCTA